MDLRNNQSKLFAESSDENKAYFDQVFSVLSQYEWVHNIHITRFLANQVWRSIPQEWIDAFAGMSADRLSRLPFYGPGESDSSNSHARVLQDKNPILAAASPSIQTEATPLPNSLVEFFQKSSSLSIRRKQVTDFLPGPACIDKELRKGMSPKKLHEVEWMASLVHHVALQSGCSVIVDVGSGLGYVDQVLHKEYGLSVIGLESNDRHSEGAERRATKQGLQCSGIQSIPFFISDNEENVRQFSQIIHDVVVTMQPCQHAPGCEPRQAAAPASRNPLPAGHDSPFPSKTLNTASVVHNVIEGMAAQIPQNTLEELTSGSKNRGNPLVKGGYSTSKRDGWKVCLIGLHCCGDLTPAMLRLYHRADFVQSLCCVSCCYHKMKFAEGGSAVLDGFVNFPMSETVRVSYDRTKTFLGIEKKVKLASSELPSVTPTVTSSSPVTSPVTSSSPVTSPVTSSSPVASQATSSSPVTSPMTSSAPVTSPVTSSSPVTSPVPSSPENILPVTQLVSVCSSQAPEHQVTREKRLSKIFLSPCSLRLAAQETRTRWLSQSAEDHERHARHMGLRALLQIFFEESDYTPEDRRIVRRLNYNSYNEFLESFVSSESKEKQKEVTGQLNSLYRSHSSYFSHIEPFTCLQVVLQPVLESLVLLDRQQWLRERGLSSNIVPIFDEHVSPRNLALLSNKLIL